MKFFPRFSPHRVSRPARAALGSLLACGALASGAWAQPANPVYQFQFNDCVTEDNRFRGSDGALAWDVDRNCDIYAVDLYERPVAQTFSPNLGRYAASEYFGYLDITQGRVGADDRYLYVAIDMASRDQITSGGSRITVGMAERYGFRVSFDPDGRYGALFVADNPETKNEPNTRFGPLGTFGYRDTNGDVGGADSDGPTGLTVTKSDNPDEEDGMNGYDTEIVADGRLLEGERTVLWVRLSPVDDTVVEFALDYRAFGITRNQLRGLKYFDIEAIKGGMKDPQNYFWNDKNTKEEAGSPNPGANGLSAFGTDGCKNIYEVDTARLVR